MRVTATMFLAALFIFGLGTGTSQERTPDTVQSIPGQWAAPRARKNQIKPEEIKEKAAELQKLADEVPHAVDQLNQGLLPKDLKDKLNRIQKLARQLRDELE